MDIGAAFVADREPAESTEPRDCSFDDPATDAQPTLPCGVRRRARIGVIPRARSRSRWGWES
jgi:hypothetical protein